MEGFGFQKVKKEKECRTLESITPPEFNDNKVIITESRSGAKLMIDGNISSFRMTKSNTFKIRICKKN